MPDGAAHVMFVLEALDCGPGLVIRSDVERVRSIIEAAVCQGLSNLTIVEDSTGIEISTGTTNLASYFSNLLQHIDNLDNPFSIRVIDEEGVRAGGRIGLEVNMVASYRGKSDVVASVKRIVEAREERGETGEAGKAGASVIEADIGQGLLAGSIRDPDLMVFFGGRRRVGEVGVWMGAYSEFAFLEKPWQAFDADDLTDLLTDFRLRERRFGAVQGVGAKPQKDTK